MQHPEVSAFFAAAAADHQVWTAPADASGDWDGAVAIVDGMCIAAHRSRAPKKKSLCCAFPGCGYAFGVAAELARHVAVAHGVRRAACPVEGCGQRFAHVGFLRAHVKCKHPGLQSTAVPRVRFATVGRSRHRLPTRK
jgi:hypothetical protein